MNTTALVPMSIKLAKEYRILPSDMHFYLESVWTIRNPAIRKELEKYFLLYHSAEYIRDKSWKNGSIVHEGITYKALFMGDTTFASIINAEPLTQFALSFRLPSSDYLSFSYIVPTVLIQLSRSTGTF